MTVIERKSDLRFITDTPYHALTASYGVSIMIVLKKIDRVVKASHCIRYHLVLSLSWANDQNVAMNLLCKVYAEQ